MKTRMNTIEESLEQRLAGVLAELARQTAQWEKTVSSLAALGDVTLAVPAEALGELDAVIQPVHAAAGGVPA